MDLRCVHCAGQAPFLFQGTSYCQTHLKIAYKRYTVPVALPKPSRILAPNETELDDVSE